MAKDPASMRALIGTIYSHHMRHGIDSASMNFTFISIKAIRPSKGLRTGLTMLCEYSASIRWFHALDLVCFDEM